MFKIPVVLLCKHRLQPFHLSATCKAIGLLAWWVILKTSSPSETGEKPPTFVSEAECRMNFWWAASHERNSDLFALISRTEHQMVLLQLNCGAKRRCSYRSVYVIGENHISMSHFSCFVSWAESAVLLGDTLWGIWQLCLGWADRALLSVRTPQCHCLVGYWFVYCQRNMQTKPWLGEGVGGQEVGFRINKGIIVWWPGAFRF